METRRRREWATEDEKHRFLRNIELACVSASMEKHCVSEKFAKQANHSFPLPCLVLYAGELCPGLEVLQEDSAACRRDSWLGGCHPNIGATGSSLSPAALQELRAEETAKEVKYWLLRHRRGYLPGGWTKGHMNGTVNWLLQLDDAFRGVSEQSLGQHLGKSIQTASVLKTQRKKNLLVCSMYRREALLSFSTQLPNQRRIFLSDSLTLSQLNKHNFRAVVFQPVLDLNKHQMWTAV